MNYHSRHSLPAFLVALMLAVAWLVQCLAILSCNFITVNTITITNGSSYNHAFYPAATSSEFATFYDYETSNVGVFCFTDSTAVSVFWKICRTLSIFTIILTTLTVTTSIACLLARISIPAEAARLWWGIGLISAIAALLSAPLFWLDPCEIIDATYRDKFDGSLATIDITCTPNTGFIEWILQGALQIMVVIITIITKAPWDVVDPATIEKNDQPEKPLALMEDDEGLENEDDQNSSDMRIQMMIEQGHLIGLLSDDNNSIAGKSVIQFSSSATVGSELSDISIFTHKEAAFGSIPPLLSHDTHSTTSAEGINDGTFNDEDERSNSSGDKENNAPLLYHHKLLIKKKKDKKDYENRSPGGNEHDYIPPPSFKLRSSFESLPQSWSKTIEDVENGGNILLHSDEAPPKAQIESMLNPNTFPMLVSNSEDDESNYVPHSIFSSSFSQRHWNKNNDQSFDEIWFASDTQSLTGSMVLSPALVEDNQEEHSKLSNHVSIDEEKIVFQNTTETDTVSLSNHQLDYTFRDFIKPSSVTVHVPPLSELNLKLLEEVFHDLDEYKNSRKHTDINALAIDSPNIASDDRRKLQKHLKNQLSKGERETLPDEVSSDSLVREGETAVLFQPVIVHTPTLSRRNRKLMRFTEDEKKPTEPSTPNASKRESSECLASEQKFLSPEVRSNINNPEKHSGVHIPLSPITSSTESKRNAVAVSSLVVGTIDRDHFIHMNTSAGLASNPSFKFCGNNTSKPPCSPISRSRSRVSTADTPRQIVIESEAKETGNLVNNGILVGTSPCRVSSSPISSFRKNHTCFAQSEDTLNVNSKPLHPNTGLNSALDQKNETGRFQVKGVERLSSDGKESQEKHNNDNAQYVPESPVMTNVYALLSELKDHVRNQKMSPMRNTQDFHEQPVERMDSIPYDEVDKSQERRHSIIPASPEQDVISSNSYFVIKPTKHQQKKTCKTGKVFSVVTPDNKMHPIASSTPPRYPRPCLGNGSKNGIILRQVEMREIQCPDPLETLSSNEMEV